jgi:small conductance mechanosensitive channel
LEKANVYLGKLVGLGVEYAPKLVLAIVTLIVGLFLIKGVLRFLGGALERRDVDPTLRPFLSGVISALLKVALLIAVAGMVGIETTSFIAVLGAAGLAVGLALQGSMSNFAGGVLLLVFKPFKVGDVVEAQGFIGSVSEIGILNTIMKTADNRTIIIPNGPLAGGPMVNFSAEPTRRVDFVFGIGYGDDIKKARDTLMSEIVKDERIFSDPAPMIVVGELGDNSVNLTVRVWSKSENYWGVFFDLQENVKNAFDNNGISIPYPQRDVHLINQSASSN